MARKHGSDTETGGTTGQWLVDRALRMAIWSALRLPYKRRVPLFGALARAAARAIPNFQQRMLDNLDHVWPDRPLEERRAIARAAADNIGRTLIEHYSMQELAQRMADVEPEGPGWEVLRAAQAAGKPAILITGHYGNHEMAFICLTVRGMSAGGLYRPMQNPYVNQHYVDAVDALGRGPLFEQGRAGMGRLLRHMRGGGTAIILNDLYVGGGIEMDFLGRPARTALSSADFALKMDAPLIPFYGIRQPDGLSFRFVLEAPIPPGTPEEMTAAFNRSLEARIVEDPGQWFWLHRRWKRKWQGGKGMVPGLHPAELPRQKSR
ncbi:lysophospholipid acyltransferase family protein [Aliiruegeria sabulilitoris]|uniref:lysophospholipid acyltransferase family protein n=1 Tax=Aliiruegeria sabulilitoris TaxID=1510458 RepID=UPI0009E8D0CA|nr:lysophospholipid acyltransferase family protein [Aliiruegeria sabulilitoris]NDR56146.1 lysophospholipid acyltransferase family protein [Pseudoruegeria sp. M32A2M]